MIDEFITLIQHEDVYNKPVLILCNKSDSANFVSADVISTKLGLDPESLEVPFHIVETSAVTKTVDSLKKGYMWLLLSIDSNYEAINSIILQNHEKAMTRRTSRVSLQKQRVLAHQSNLSSPDLTASIKQESEEEEEEEEMCELQINVDKRDNSLLRFLRRDKVQKHHASTAPAKYMHNEDEQERIFSF